MTAVEVFEEIEKDIEFYKNSGGGVTLSGGEPLIQAKFARSILLSCRSAGIHTAIDTCGFAPWDDIASVLPLVDLVLFDLKSTDKDKHRQYTGVSNDLILQNAKEIGDFGTQMIIRIPVIPGFNDRLDDINSFADFVRSLRTVARVDILPYHRIGVSKYKRLGRHYLLRAINSSELDETVKCYKEILEKSNFNVKIEG